MRFVLVHGGYHGAWCWDRLVPELERLGHIVLAVDLPGCGERLAEPASLASWRGALREVIEEGDVLVGHSMGGFAISLAADEVPDKVARLTYLSAAVPLEGHVMRDATEDTVAIDWADTVGLPYEDFMEVVDLPNQGPCVALTKQEAANKLFYHDCTPEDQDWAWDHLTPLPMAPAEEPFHLPRFWNAAIPRDYIVTTDDFSHSTALDNRFMERLGLSTAFSIRSSHSPFISRPADTAKLLDLCASDTLSARETSRTTDRRRLP
jgi:pimeloyl-ACP methyl ester carboxylesterase